MPRPRLLMLTRLFPSRAMPTLGTFCMERARALAVHADVRVMVPTPWFPAWKVGPPQWRAWAGVERRGLTAEGLQVSYPRYLSVPGMATWAQGPSMARAVRRELASQHPGWVPDIVDGHFAYPDGYAAVQLARHLGCHSLVTCHGADLRLYPQLALTGAMLAWTMRTASRVISVSTALMQRSVALGCATERAVMLGNRVDAQKFSLRTKRECRQALGLPLDRPIAAYVGFLIDRKDQSLILRALQEIRRRGETVPLLLLVGDGPNRQRLEDEVRRLGLVDDVVFAGQRRHEEVASWMGAADWLLLSSDYEGWATVYFEAMACGRPVLTSDVSSARDAVPLPAYGKVVTPRTAPAFASAMIEAMHGDYDAAAIRAYAQTQSWAGWAEQVMGMIGELRGNTLPHPGPQPAPVPALAAGAPPGQPAGSVPS